MKDNINKAIELLRGELQARMDDSDIVALLELLEPIRDNEEATIS